MKPQHRENRENRNIFPVLKIPGTQEKSREPEIQYGIPMNYSTISTLLKFYNKLPFYFSLFIILKKIHEKSKYVLFCV